MRGSSLLEAAAFFIVLVLAANYLHIQATGARNLMTGNAIANLERKSNESAGEIITVSRELFPLSEDRDSGGLLPALSSEFPEITFSGSGSMSFDVLVYDENNSAVYEFSQSNEGDFSKIEIKKNEGYDRERGYKVDVIPAEGPIKKISFDDMNPSKSNELRVSDAPEEELSVQTYAIDPAGIDFSQASVTVTAEGKSLFKCADWNFSGEQCHGDWVFLRSITPGENYTLILTRDDPAFAEYNFSTHPSSPAAGQKAYASTNAGAKPPSGGPSVPNEIEFTAAQYGGINASDGSYATSASANYRAHRFVFNVTENRDSVLQINASWRGYASGAAAPRTVDLYVWNFTGSSWGSSLGQNTLGSVAWINVSLTSGFSDRINSSGAFIFLVESGDPSASQTLYSDFARISVKYAFPTATLYSPANGNVTPSNNITFICNATDDVNLSNITLYWNYSGSWQSNGTVAVGGSSSNSSFARENLDNGPISWSCRACNTAGYCAFAASNWTATVDYAPPASCIASLSTNSFDFGTMSPGYDTAAANKNVTITNTGAAAAFNTTIRGTNWTDGGSNSFDVACTRWNTTAFAYSSGTNLTLADELIPGGNLGPGASAAAHFGLKIPLRQALATYNQTITITMNC